MCAATRAFVERERHVRASWAIFGEAAKTGDATALHKAKTTPHRLGIVGNTRPEDYDSQITLSSLSGTPPSPAPAGGRTRRGGASPERGWIGRPESWPETSALVLLLTYVPIAPVPYGEITRGGTLCLELLAFPTTVLLFLDRPPLA